MNLRLMGPAFDAGVKQALEFFQNPKNVKTAVKGAKRVMLILERMAKSAK